MSKKLTSLVLAGWLLMVTTGVQAATLTLGPDADTYIPNTDTTPHGDAAFMYLHDTSNSVGYLRFDLAKANVTAVQGAKLTLYVSGNTGLRNDNVVAARFFLHGLNSVAGNTPQNWSEATLTSANVGAEWKANNGEPLINLTDLDDTTAGAGITETITLVGANYYDVGGIRIVVTGDGLAKFLQSRAEDNGLATLLLEFPGTAGGRGFGIASKENTLETIRPVLELTCTVGPKTGAAGPVPADKATGVSRRATLSWKAGESATGHDVYLSTSADDVAAGKASVLVSAAQDANSYAPAAPFAYGQTYYWRVDEIGPTVSAGAVWSFTVEPLAYAIANVTATASSADGGSAAQNTVNGSGLDSASLHSTGDGTMWISAKGAAGKPWIQFAFDRVYKLYEMWVWNHNTSLEEVLGAGAQEVTIEYSADGTTWTVLNPAAIFNQAPGTAGYAHNTTVDFQGVAARYVKLTIQNNWGGILAQSGLSEVRFFQIPVQAAQPVPASAAANIDPRSLVLGWTAGREAVSHQIYLGTDKQAVTDGTAPVATSDQTGYAPAALLLGTTYYWKVVEVNQAAKPASWASDVWSFTTAGVLVVDDFESYTDEAGNEIFTTWVDGFDDPTKNGAIVGHDTAPFAERAVLHGGRQSMPLAYNNAGGVGCSEAVRTFTAPQDWSQYGLTTLTLWFRGDPNNAAAPLYVKINATKVLFNGGTPSTGIGLWKQWNIDLASLGISLKSVKTLTIGVGDGKTSGSGTIYVDDILLYATAPQAVAPADPGAGGLVALYALEGNVQDASGKGNNGTLSGNPVYVNSMSGYGKALKFDGLDDHVTLPIGSLIKSLNSMTVATWVNFTGSTGAWQRAFDFGSDTTNYMFLTPSMSGTTAPRFAIRTAAVAEQLATASAALSVGWHHLAVVIDSTTMTLKLYVDGAVVATGATTLLPKDLGATTQNWLGRSQFTADAFLNSTLDDFRIYNIALTEGQVRYLAGDR